MKSFPSQVWNVFHTPSHGACFRSAHKAAGRVGLPCSLLGAGFGFLTVWWERYAVLEAGQRIGLSVVGALQLYSSVVGWRAIRAVRGEDHEEERAAKIRTHKLHMINVFMCCFGASMLRVAPKVLGALGVSMDTGDGALYSIMAMILGTNVCGWSLGRSLGVPANSF